MLLMFTAGGVIVLIIHSAPFTEDLLTRMHNIITCYNNIHKNNKNINKNTNM